MGRRGARQSLYTSGSLCIEQREFVQREFVHFPKGVCAFSPHEHYKISCIIFCSAREGLVHNGENKQEGEPQTVICTDTFSPQKGGHCKNRLTFIWWQLHRALRPAQVPVAHSCLLMHPNSQCSNATKRLSNPVAKYISSHATKQLSSPITKQPRNQAAKQLAQDSCVIEVTVLPSLDSDGQ